MEFPKKRYHGLHIPNLLSPEDQNKLSCLDLSNIFLSMQIGSESQVGKIYLASLFSSSSSSLSSLSFVIKVQSNINKTRSEYEIQHYLSQKWPNNFAMTYEGKQKNCIFMETAIGDLEQVIKYSIVDENMLTSYILDVIDSVEIMSTEKVFHGDLHIRQIFIVLRNGNTRKAVIGDFGEHLRIDSPTTHLSDLKIFFKSLLEIISHVENSDKFIYKISQCLNLMSQRTLTIELNDLSYNSESLQRDISEIKTFFKK